LCKDDDDDDDEDKRVFSMATDFPLNQKSPFFPLNNYKEMKV